jgi:hypothetical protein
MRSNSTVWSAARTLVKSLGSRSPIRNLSVSSGRDTEEECECIYCKGVDAKTLVLWKVSFFITNNSEQKFDEYELDDNAKLRQPISRLSSVFGNLPVEGHLHILIQLPCERPYLACISIYSFIFLHFITILREFELQHFLPLDCPDIDILPHSHLKRIPTSLVFVVFVPDPLLLANVFLTILPLRLRLRPFIFVFDSLLLSLTLEVFFLPELTHSYSTLSIIQPHSFLESCLLSNSLVSNDLHLLYSYHALSPRSSSSCSSRYDLVTAGGKRKPPPLEPQFRKCQCLVV